MGHKRGWSQKETFVVLLAWLAAVVRLWNLGEQSLWFDEAFSWLCATAPLPQAIQIALVNFVHPPLYYLLLRPVMLLGDGEFQLRLLSAWAGVLGVPLLYATGSRLSDRRTALLAASLLALNPFHVWYSREARMYALLFDLALAVGYFFERATSKGGSANWLGLGISSSLAYVTHYFALLLPLAQFAFLLTRFRRTYRLLRRWATVQAVAALPIGLWIGGLYQLPERAMGIGWIPRPAIWDLLLTAWNFGLGPLDRWTLPAAVGSLPLLAGLAWAIRVRQEKRWWKWWLALPPVFVLLLSWGTGRYFYVDRFFIICLPPYLLLSAWGITHLPHRRAQRVLTTLALLALTVGSARLHLDPAVTKEDWREAVAFVNDHARPDDQVVVDQEEWTLLVRYYGCDLPVSSLSTTSLQALWTSLGPGERMWLLYRHRGESAHLVARSQPFDIFKDADPATAEWLEAHREHTTAHLRLPGVDLLRIEKDRGGKEAGG